MNNNFDRLLEGKSKISTVIFCKDSRYVFIVINGQLKKTPIGSFKGIHIEVNEKNVRQLVKRLKSE